ncbi:MAG: N-acetylmuramoyl-L-alanine amidase, partial [Bacilli bacterium]
EELLSTALEKVNVKVKATTLFIRSGPGVTYESVGKLIQGDIVTVNKTENNWYQINYNNNNGWISVEFTEKVQTNTNQSNDNQQEDSKEDQSSEQLQVKIINTGTNLREGPSLQHKVVSKGQQGELYPVIETSGEWFKVKLTDGKEAYIAGWVVTPLNTGTTTTTPPVVNSPNMLKGKRFVIDPGHGGRDSGAIGSQYKTYEKDINLTVSKILAAKLEAAGATVVLSRSIDQTISLQNRVDLSIAKSADAFISIHHNTNFNSNVNGTIMYYYSNGKNRDLAQIIQSEVVKRNGLNNMGARQGNFFVLRENPQLAILAELAFLSNKKDEGAARSSDFQEQSAEGIFQGLYKYFNTL